MILIASEEFVEYRDVKPVAAWEKFAGVAADRLRPECNEWYISWAIGYRQWAKGNRQYAIYNYV